MKRLRRAALALCLPGALAAQGTLGGQGFGYPAGQLGARAAATGGALGPFDALSPINPASITGFPRAMLFVHLEPEYRSTRVDGAEASTSESRMPLAGGAARIGKHGTLAVTVSTYLDRTWQTSSAGTEQIGNDTVNLTTSFQSSGAINDVRLAYAWAFDDSVKIGVGFHAYTGENRLTINWVFPDSGQFGDVSQKGALTYTGTAFSLGGEFKIARHVGVSAYGRIGGGARMSTGDTVVSKANMPDHVGFAVKYDGLTGTVIAAAWEHIGWSALRSLGSADIGVRDAQRISIGAESRGPSLGGTPVYLRAGVAHRTLPFSALGSQVSETLVTAGLGYTLARGAANVDFAVQHAARSAGAGRETAWLWTLGFAITP